MNIILAANPKQANSAGTLIDFDVTFDGIGTVQYTASPEDSTEYGRALYASAIAGEFGAIAPYVAPPAVIPSVVSMRQARLALLASGLLASVNAAVAAMAGAEGEAARIEWEYAATVDRNSPLVAGLAAALGLTAGQLDSLFATAAGL